MPMIGIVESSSSLKEDFEDADEDSLFADFDVTLGIVKSELL